MKHLYILLILTASSSIFNNLNATRVSGHVMSINNVPVAYALVKGDSTIFGAFSNEEGYYEMDMVPGRYTLVAEITGFKSVYIPVIITDRDTTVDFKMDEQEYTLPAVTVTNTGEDPAYGIMRKVLYHKKTRKSLIRSIESDIYLKGVIGIDGMPEKMIGKKISDTAKAEMGVDSHGRGIVYILEQQSRVKAVAPDKVHTEVISVRQAGDPQGLGFATLPPIVDFYRDVVMIISEVNDRGFVSPLHDNAFLYYKYRLDGSYTHGDRIIYKINIIPKRKHEPCFYGSIYIVDGDYELKALDLIATKDQGVNILDTLSFKQSYKLYPNTRHWIIESQTIIPYLSFFGFKLNGSFLTTYANQKLNGYIDPKTFEGDIISTYDRDAWKKGKEYWDTVRTVPLTEKEMTNYHRIDSMAATYKAREDSTKKTITPLIGVNDFLVGGPGFKTRDFTFKINNILDIYNFNSVEGHNLTIKPTLTYSKYRRNEWQAAYHLRYGLSSERWYQRAYISYQHRNSKRSDRTHYFRISGGRYIDEFTGLWNVSELFNSYMTLVEGRNILHFYEKQYLSGRYDYNGGNGWRFSIRLANEARSPLVNNTDYSWASSNKKNIQPNQPNTIFDFMPHRATTAHMSIYYQPGWKYIQYPYNLKAIPSGRAEYYLHYTKGLQGILGSDVDYDKWSVGVEHFKSLGLLGRFDYHLNVGGFLNSNYIGIPDLHHFKSSELLLENQYLLSFQMAPYFRLSNASPVYGRAHLEWHLFGLLTNKIPLFNKLDWHLVLATNSIYLNKHDYYSEVSLGLENIGFKMFRFLRVSYIMSIDSKRDNGKPSFGLRIGANSNILTNAVKAFD